MRDYRPHSSNRKARRLRKQKESEDDRMNRHGRLSHWNSIERQMLREATHKDLLAGWC